MINTQPLTEAVFAAKTTEEMQFCRMLANSIAARSPYAWKLYYEDDPTTILSKKSMKALEKVMIRVEKWEKRRYARKRLEFGKGATESLTKNKEEKARPFSDSTPTLKRSPMRVKMVQGETSMGQKRKGKSTRVSTVLGRRSRGAKFADPDSEEERMVAEMDKAAAPPSMVPEDKGTPQSS